MARSADDLAPPGGGIRRRSADRLLRPLERLVLRRARAPLSVRRREQQALHDALALVHRGPEHGRLPRPGLHGAGRADGRCALLRRLGDRAARRPRPGAEGREQRDERAGRPRRRLPLPRAPAGAASGRRLHEHHQLLQLLRLRDLRPLREPHPRPERGGDRRRPRRRLVRSSRRRPDRAAGRPPARHRARRRPRSRALSGPDGAVPARARRALAERVDAPRRRVPRERRRDDLRRQPEQPERR